MRAWVIPWLLLSFPGSFIYATGFHLLWAALAWPVIVASLVLWCRKWLKELDT